MSDEMAANMGPTLVLILAGRLQIIGDRAKYPEIAKEKIVKPIFFIGMSRTGSTLIQSLFAQDPANMAPEFWETMLPSPPPKFGIDPERKARVAQIMRWHMEGAPGFDVQHPYFIEDGYRAHAECNNLTEWSFTSIQIAAFYPVHSYWKWYLTADLEETVQFHHMALQHLQWGRSGRHWVSKSIDWGLFLDPLIKEYPDGKYIWTHRNPMSHVASLASNLAVVRQYGGLPITDLHEMGDLALEMVGSVFDRAMETRERADPSLFFDSYYEDLHAAPVERIRYIYENFLDRDLTAEAQLRMESWLRNNEQTKHGAHVYSAADYGLTPEKVETRLSKYIERYGQRFKRS